MVNVINNGKHYKVQRIEDKPTSAFEQTRSEREREREEINTGLLEMSHTWTENSVRLKSLCTNDTILDFLVLNFIIYQLKMFFHRKPCTMTHTQ